MQIVRRRGVKNIPRRHQFINILEKLSNKWEECTCPLGVYTTVRALDDPTTPIFLSLRFYKEMNTKILAISTAYTTKKRWAESKSIFNLVYKELVSRIKPDIVDVRIRTCAWMTEWCQEQSFFSHTKIGTCFRKQVVEQNTC